MDDKLQKQNKTLKIILIIVLVIVLIVGAYYLGKEDVFSKKEDAKAEEKGNQEQKNTSKEIKEKVEISEEELNKYLSYVPSYSGSGNNYKINQNNSYKQKKMNLEIIDKYSLLGMALKYAVNDDYFYQKHLDYNWDGIGLNFIDENQNIHYVEKEKIEPILEKMYNINLSSFNLKENQDDFTTVSDGRCFAYIENGFAESPCSGGTYIVHIIENYEVENDELKIIEYPYSYEELGDDELRVWNIYNNEYKIIDIQNESRSNYEIAEQYVKNKYAKYKHTFKKNNTGYYWDSTELVQ